MRPQQSAQTGPADGVASGRSQAAHRGAKSSVRRVSTTGIAGAPKVGDKAAWGPRIAQGKETLYSHAIKGFQGKAGMMPAKGARADLPDSLVKETVDYIVKMNQ